MNALRNIRAPAFSLVEVIIATAMLTIAITALCAAYLSSVSLDGVSQQAAIATQAARRKMEELPLENFSTLFERYNSLPADDPGGAGTAPGSQYQALSNYWQLQGLSAHPGSNFPVTGLEGLPFDIPGYGRVNAIGRIEFRNYDASRSLHEIHVRIVWKGPAERTAPHVPPIGTTSVDLVTLVSQRVP